MGQTYCVSYDLRQPGRDYSALYRLLRSYPSWCHVMESYWLIQTADSATTVRDAVANVVDQNDRIFVAVTAAPAAWQGLSDDVSEWLRTNL